MRPDAAFAEKSPMFFTSLTAVTLALAAANTAADAGTTLWAGHHVQLGSRDLPFRGKTQTRTDTYVLSRVRRVGDKLVMTERACAVNFAKVGGVKVWMDATALPASTFTLHEADDGWVGTSHVKWAREDVDDDGEPGMTVHVDGVCSGQLHVANDSLTMATADVDDGSIRGKARVTISQRILGANGKCLEWMAKDTAEVVSARFSYVPVSEETTCESLTRRGWPVKVGR